VKRTVQQRAKLQRSYYKQQWRWVDGELRARTKK